MTTRMRPDRLDLIEERIPLRPCAIVRGQLRELVDEVRASWAREGPSPAWLQGLQKRAAETLKRKGDR